MASISKDRPADVKKAEGLIRCYENPRLSYKRRKGCLEQITRLNFMPAATEKVLKWAEKRVTGAEPVDYYYPVCKSLERESKRAGRFCYSVRDFEANLRKSLVSGILKRLADCYQSCFSYTCNYINPETKMTTTAWYDATRQEIRSYVESYGRCQKEFFGCFTAGAYIYAKNLGAINMSELAERFFSGEMLEIMTVNEATGAHEYKKVDFVKTHDEFMGGAQVLDLTYITSLGEYVKTTITGNHPMAVLGRDGSIEYKKADLLEKGARLYMADGNFARLVSVDDRTIVDELLYNIHMSPGNHNYLVSPRSVEDEQSFMNIAVLAHNIVK